MINSTTRWNIKMVILLATALAIGISTVAACVVPWVYCKPSDDADDNRDESPLREGSNCQQPNNEQNTTTTVAIHTRSLFTIVNPVTMNPQSTENRRSARSTSARDNAVNCDQNLSPNPMNVESGCPTVHQRIEQDEISRHCSRAVDPSSAEVPNVAASAIPNCIRNLPPNSMNAEARYPAIHQDDQPVRILEIPNVGGISMANCILNSLPNLHSGESRFPKVANFASSTGRTQNSEIVPGDTEKSRDGRSLDADQIMESRLPNPGLTELPSTARIKDHSANNLQTIKTLIATDEFSTESTTRSSGLGDSGSVIHTDERSAERTDPSRNAESVESQSGVERNSMMESIASESLGPRSTDTESSEQCYVNQIEGDASWRRQTSDPSNATNDSAIETSEMDSLMSLESSGSVLAVLFEQSTRSRSALETIVEDPSRSASSRKAAPLAELLQDVISNRSQTPDGLPKTSHGTPHSAYFNPHDCPLNAEIKRSQMGNAWSLSRVKVYLKKLTPRRLRKSGEVSLRESHTDSVHDLSAGSNAPAGHSTVLSSDSQLLQEIQRRRSMRSSMDSAKRVEDPRVLVNIQSNEARPVIQTDRELELSNRTSPISDETTLYLPAPQRNTRISGFSREVVRCLTGSPRERTGSRSSQQGTSRSDSLLFRKDSPKLSAADENHNLSADLSIDGTNVTISEPEGCASYSERIDGKRKWRKFKNRIFRRKHRSKEINKVSPSDKRITNSDNVPVECQRNLTGMSSNSDEHPNNCKVESTSITPDAIFDHERSLIGPCTEL